MALHQQAVEWGVTLGAAVTMDGSDIWIRPGFYEQPNQAVKFVLPPVVNVPIKTTDDFGVFVEERNVVRKAAFRFVTRLLEVAY